MSAYLFLMSSCSNSHYGDIFSIDARKPLGRRAIEKLVVYNRIDLIRNILAYGKQGRPYAIEALLCLEKSIKSI